MTTLNLTVDDQVASRAEQVARERNTTLNQLVSEFLEHLTPAEQAKRTSSADRLAKTFRDLSRPIGGKPYQNRDELYDR
jgi:hypothetical protein